MVIVKKNGDFILDVEKYSDKKYKLILLVISIFSFFTRLGVEDVGLMESRNFIAAREMIVNGNWLIPTLNGVYRFEKPPFPTWMTALIMKITGDIESTWILRLPAALLSVWLVFLMYRIIKRISNNNFLAFISAGITATNFMIMKEGVVNTWDIFSYGLMFASIVYLYEYLEDKKKYKCWIASFLLGASIMSKGPVAPYGMLLPFLVMYFFMKGKNNFLEKGKSIIIYIIIGTIFAALWPVYMIVLYKSIFFSVMGKEQDTWDTKAVEGFFYYFDYFVYTGGWILFNAMGMLFLLKKKWLSQSNKKLLELGFIWSLLSLLLISFIKMKKQRYGIPLYIITNIPCGVIVCHYYKKPQEMFKKYEKWIFILQGGLIGISFAAMVVLFAIKGVHIKESIGKNGVFIVEILLYLAVLVSYLITLKKYKEHRNKVIIVFTGIAMLIVNGTGVWFIEKELMYRHKRVELEDLHTISHIEPDLKMYSFNFKIEDVWRVGRKIIRIGEDKTTNNATPALIETPNELPENFLLFTEEDENSDILKEKTDINGYTVINQWKFYRNFRNNKIVKVYEIQLKK
ncbi:MAG: glycosyltransferase family 39 protein [Fusobacteriaceae bacterium]|nr:glycosyltransferase family 39 protein [Fusobacteriaceae bacterium]MBP9510225.1 glycosyltransferase family 39 protein [Fusobacteriaceae bacterium]